MYQVIDAFFSMTMDVYRQIDVQDENTGNIKKEWQYYKNIPCHAKGIISKTGSRSGDNQSFGNRYIDEQTIEVRTSEKITVREKITNICSSDGDIIWEEVNFPTNTPTVFEVISTTPLTDPFGKILGYNSSMKRSENQIIGL